MPVPAQPGAGEGMPSDSNSPASRAEASRLDAVFSALSHERRRYALYYLRQRPDGTASTGELAEALTERQGGDGEVETVAASLVHHHLPKLADAGLVEHDAQSETVRFAPAGAVAAELVDLVAGFELG